MADLHAGALAAQLEQARQQRILLAREDVNVFAAFILKDERNGKRIRQADVHRQMHALLDSSPRAVIWGFVESGKQLCLRTPVPTPTGWRTMGDLAEGDTVFGRDGQPCRVEWLSPVTTDGVAYEVVFDDGAVVTADAEHQWLAWSIDDLGQHKPPRVVTTARMLQQVTRHYPGRALEYTWKVPLCGPVQYPERELPVHPYVLGAWLGDGNSAGPVLTFHGDDREVYDRCQRLEGAPDRAVPIPKREHLFRGPLGADYQGSRDPAALLSRLRALGVLGNKHIPDAYLLASEGQRRELLAGLLDTDGHLARKGGRASQVEYTSVSLPLATGVLELARSLGFKARLSTQPAKLYGRVVGERHRVHFTAREPVFQLARKRDSQAVGWLPGRARHRSIVAIRPVPSVPMRCIGVDSPDHTYLADRSYTVTHNSEQIVVARIVHALGRDPSLRIGIVGATLKSATKLLKKIGTLIATSEEVRAVFPHLKPSVPWNESSLTVQRETTARDPSVQAIGLHTALLGSRLDLLALDDVVNQENSKNPARRKDVLEWILGTLFGRLTEDARIWVVGNAFHPEDAMHVLAKTPGWVGKRFPVQHPVTGLSVWPERWSDDRIAARRSDIGPLEFARTMLCQPRSEDDARFKRADIDACLELGKGLGDVMPTSMEDWRPTMAMEVKRRCRFYTGVDLAVQTHAAADLSAIFTIAVHPDGVREVIGLESGRWPATEILQRIGEAHRRWGSVVVIENVAAQEWMRQFAKIMQNVPARPFTTGRGQASLEFQAESLAAEVAAHQWIIPCDSNKRLHPELSEWVQALLFYNPSAHTPDRMAAGLFARWLAQQGDAVGAGGPIISIQGQSGGGPGGGGGGGLWG